MSVGLSVEICSPGFNGLIEQWYENETCLNMRIDPQISCSVNLGYQFRAIGPKNTENSKKLY